MSNLPNRSNYGFLSCLFSLLKSRFDPSIKDFNLTYLKYDETKNKNTINYCSGAINFDNKIQSNFLKREKYCPFVKDPTSKHVCNLVYSIQSDSQKSKATGTAALLLEILDLIKINYSESGKIKNINWTKNAYKINQLNWGDKELGSYFIEKILSFGPVLGLIYFVKNLSTKSGDFKRSQIKKFLGFPSIDEEIEGSELCNKSNCENKKNKFLFPTGTTTSDSLTRTMKSLFFLTAATGIIRPKNTKFKVNPQLFEYPFLIDDWYFNKWKKMSEYPSEWVYDEKILNNHFKKEIPKIRKIINYENLIQKSAHRNYTNKCMKCEKNLINLFYKLKGQIIKDRRFLLLKAIAHGNLINKKLNIKELSKFTLGNKKFCLSKKNHFNSLIKDLDLANLCGFFVYLDKDLITSKNNLKEVEFGNPKYETINEIKKILSEKIYV